MPDALDGVDVQPRQRGAGQLLHLAVVEQPPSGYLASEEHVLDDVEVVAQRQVLVHDLDSERRSILGALDVHGPTLEMQLARIGLVDTHGRLDQHRLAGTVVADERCDLARIHAEIDVV